MDLVEWMIRDGWDATKSLSIKEKSMPKAMKISELKDCDGKPLDLSVEASSHAISLRRAISETSNLPGACAL